MDLSRVCWLIARVKAMPLRELVHRFKEIFNKLVLSVKPTAKSKEFFASNPGSHFEPGMAWLKEQKQASTAANSVLLNGPTIFGRLWQENGKIEIEWHKSLSGDDFESVKAFKVDYRSTDNWETDIRQLWELNRLVWLIPVAQHFATTQDPETGQYLKRTLSSYLKSDQPGYSVRWNSAIEIAVQALSLLSIEKIVGNQAVSIFPSNYLESLSTRLRWLERLPSKYSSENNHRVAEVAAQIAIYSRLEIERKLQQKCEVELSRLILNQFWSDGFNKEQSFGYHLFTLDLVATAKVLVPSLSFSEEAFKRLQLASQVTSDVYSFCNFWPSANDSDEAQLLGVIETAGDPPFQLFSSVFGQAKSAQKGTQSLHLKDAGYFFAKSSLADLSLVLMVDHGELGLAPLYAHAHADIQSIWLWADRYPVLVEAGTFTYHSSEEFRKLLQGSLAHSSISIEGSSIVEPLGPFLWNKNQLPHSAKFEYTESENNFNIIMSCQLPLEHLEFGPALWKRQILLEGSQITIVDELVGNEKYHLGTHLILDCKFDTHSQHEMQTRLVSQSVIVDISNDGLAHSIEEFSISPRYSHLASGLKFAGSSSGKNSSSLRTSIRIRRNS